MECVTAANDVWTEVGGANRLIPGQIRFCAFCGGSLSHALPYRGPTTFSACDRCIDAGVTLAHNSGPALLVLTQIFAENRILLMKRGRAPYEGKWAPPGGFVETGESPETAAVREVWEEVRIKLDRTQLVPHALVSIPKINQVYHTFIVRLQERLPASAVQPESLEVGWFSEAELRQIELWDPGAHLDMELLFEVARSGRFHFHQQTDSFSRVITEQGRVRYRWRRD